jgi:hypothetical protein
MTRISFAYPFRKQALAAEGNRKEWILRHTGVQFHLLACRYPGIYLLIVLSIAFLGYAYFLLLFPILVIVSSLGILKSQLIHQAPGSGNLQIHVLVLGISVPAIYRIIRFRPALPESTVRGIKLTTAPLSRLVDDDVRHDRCERIDRVVFTAEFELGIVKTPRRSLPIWPASTLVIGLPLIHCFSMTRFQCALASLVDQFPLRRKWHGNLLCQLRDIWPQYYDTCHRYSPGYQPVCRFFSLSAPIYRAIYVPAAGIDELAADTC